MSAIMPVLCTVRTTVPHTTDIPVVPVHKKGKKRKANRMQYDKSQSLVWAPLTLFDLKIRHSAIL